MHAQCSKQPKEPPCSSRHTSPPPRPGSARNPPVNALQPHVQPRHQQNPPPVQNPGTAPREPPANPPRPQLPPPPPVPVQPDAVRVRPANAESTIEFVHEPPEELYCQICTNIMTNPQMCPQGHSFCQKCIVDWLAHSSRRTGTCPIDRQQLPVNKLIHNIAVDGIIGRLRVFCSRKADGCTWEGEQNDHANHRDRNCEYRQLTCPNEGCGCQIPFCKLNDHLAFHCDFRQESCSYCWECIKVKDIEKHLDECTEFLVECPQDCEKRVPRKDLKKHCDEKCETVLVLCPFSPLGCAKDFIKRGNLNHHLTKHQTQHTALVIKAITDARNESTSNVQLLFEPQFEALSKKWQQAMDESLAKLNKTNQEESKKAKDLLLTNWKNFTACSNSRFDQACAKTADKALEKVMATANKLIQEKLEQISTQANESSKKMLECQQLAKNTENHAKQVLLSAAADIENKVRKQTQECTASVEGRLKAHLHAMVASQISTAKKQISNAIQAQIATEMENLRKENLDMQLARTNVIRHNIDVQCSIVRNEWQTAAGEIETAIAEMRHDILQVRLQQEMQDTHQQQPAPVPVDASSMVSRREYAEMCEDYKARLSRISATMNQMQTLLSAHMQNDRPLKERMQADMHTLLACSHKRPADEAVSPMERQQKAQKRNTIVLSDSEVGIHD